MTGKAEEVWEKFKKIAEIGKDEKGGISRTFGSIPLDQARVKIGEYFQECGMTVWYDTAGNVHGWLDCEKENAPEICMGSHLDTVKEGGMFDGLLGIVAAAECVRTLREEKISRSCNLHVIATNGEEGNDLGGTFGSRAMAGILPLDSPEYTEKLKKYGFSREKLSQAVLDPKDKLCYLELHIEQGPTLWKHGVEIGVVTGIVGLQRYKVTVHGKSNHAGTTMMEDRDDALVSAAKLILEGDRLARETGRNFVETVGNIHVYPGSAPVIPSRVEMILEIRNEDEGLMASFMYAYGIAAEKIAKTDIELLVKKSPITCSSKLTDVMEEVCEEQGISCRRMPSGATHDGNAMAKLMPVGMIFVPSKEGISHSSEEWTEWKDAWRGINVLVETVKKLQSEEKLSCWTCC